MSILYPLMAWGFAVAAVPIWLHLRRRDENNLVEFSTLRFLDDQPLARARPLWPRHWPLLLLRLLALLLLVTAFSWPYVQDRQTVAIRESRVYLLDNTLSHHVDDGFVTARDQIVEQLNSGDVRTQVGVIELGSNARVLVRFGDDPISAAQVVSRLQPSAERGSFIDGFRAANEMLRNSLGAERRIVLLSDSQANQWTRGADSAPFLTDVKIDLPSVPSASPMNMSLSEPTARRVFRNGRHSVEAGVTFTTNSPRRQATAVFRDRGRPVARVNVQPAGSDPDRVQSVFAEWECDASEWLLGEVVIEDAKDALDGDNRVVFSLPPRRPGRVALLADSLFLRRALAPEVMLGRWQIDDLDGERLANRTQDTESAADVVCVESQALLSSDLRKMIRDDLNAGRGVLLWVEQATPLISGFLRELGIELQSPQIRSSDPATFRYVFAEHPIFAPFRSGELGNLAEIQFSSYRRLQVRQAMPLAFSASGDPLVFEVDVGPGRMLVFAFAMVRDDTNWPIHPTFIPFLDKSLQYVRGEASTTTAYEPGELVAWKVPAGASAEEIVVSSLEPGKSKIREKWSNRFAVGDGGASFHLPSRSGHYAVRLDEEDKMAAVLDVNPSPLESDLRYEAEPAAVTAWRKASVRSDEAEANSISEGIELTTMEALQQQLWWYILVTALAAFLVETVYVAVKNG